MAGVRGVLENPVGAEMTVAAVSGGFDPVTPGHIALFRSAAALGNVHVFLNSDDWLIRKKGYYLFSWAERRLLLEAITNIQVVHEVDDADGTVCAALRKHRPDWFVNGGDRTAENTPEAEVCKELGIAMHFSGDPKISSSSVVMKRGVSERSWGRYELIYQGPTDKGYIKVKRLILNPMALTSRQKHKFRTEYFFPLTGHVHLETDHLPLLTVCDGEKVPPGQWHQLSNEDGELSSVLEVQVGAAVEEDDIEREA